jgi:hypothetical protein
MTTKNIMTTKNVMTTKKMTTKNVMTTKKITTTKKTTTPAPANQSYKVCSDTNSTSASGSVQPLGGLTPNTTARTCNFNINAPVGQQVQLTCWAVSLSTLNLSQAGFSPVVINSLTVSESFYIRRYL